MKKILALLTVVAVMLSCTAVFAADEVVYEHVGGKYTVTYNGTADTMYGFVVIAPTITGEGEDQSVTYNVSNLSNSNLLYIDQQTADSTGKVTFSKFMLKDGATADANGYYGKVFIGGGESSATALGFVGGEKVITGVKVSGTVTDAENSRETVVTLYDATGAAVDTTTTVSGAYSFDEVVAGTYSVEFTKASSLAYTYTNVVVEEEDLTVDATLKGCAGDANNSTDINASDLSAVLNEFGAFDTTSTADVNGSTDVNASDLSIILNNFGNTADDFIKSFTN